MNVRRDIDQISSIAHAVNAIDTLANRIENLPELADLKAELLDLADRAHQGLLDRRNTIGGIPVVVDKNVPGPNPILVSTGFEEFRRNIIRIDGLDLLTDISPPPVTDPLAPIRAAFLDLGHQIVTGLDNILDHLTPDRGPDPTPTTSPETPDQPQPQNPGTPPDRPPTDPPRPDAPHHHQ